MEFEHSKLDHPAWYSLSETHEQFKLELGEVKFYDPKYCQFGDYLTSNPIPDAIAQYSEFCSRCFVIGKQPKIPDGFAIENEMTALQMVINHEISLPIKETIVELKAKHLKDVLNLVAVAYPGFFQEKTLFLGRNFGIFKNNQLVAMTEERMKMYRYTEVSAVITHPQHTGKGYAKQLITHTVKQIIKENKTPYLHVSNTNSHAISLYKKLGFYIRKEMKFWGVKNNIGS